MSADTFDIAYKVVSLLLWIFVGVYTYLSNRNRVTNERIGSLEDHVDTRLDNHSERLARLEKSADMGPNHEDLKALHRRIDALVASVNGLQGEFKGTSHTLALIHEYLLKERREK